MDGFAEKQQESRHAVVVVIENEAESVQGEKSGARDRAHLDTCTVCHLNFHSREPKLLPCLHSFCKKCLPSPSRNLATAEPLNPEADKPLNVIRCPVCRQECMAVDVMDNVFAKDPTEAPSSTVERTVQLCMTCDDNTEAAGFCVDCVEYLCATCVDAHQRVKFTKDHTIRQRTDALPEVHSVSALRPVFCDIHRQEPLKLFCETCDLLTCRDCQLIKHKDHNYQFLEDAYKNHKHHMETMTHQLQEKKKLIEEVSNSIDTALLLVDKNRTSVHNEIKKSICSLILEINKKGKILANQLEAVTKDHERVLQKQQEDIGYLSRHLDHVINFIKWATARNGGTALLYCKRLILFQIGNLLQAKCSAAFVPQSNVRFQCRASHWASNVDLGSLVVESIPGHQLGGFQGISHRVTYPGHHPSGSPHSFAPGAPHSTLAQLQMQVEKLNPQAHWQSQPPPPPWTCFQSVQLQRTVPGPLQGSSSSRSMPPQPGSRSMVPPSSHVSPTISLPNPGFSPQITNLLRGTGSSSHYQNKPGDLFSSASLYLHESPLPISGGVSLPQPQQTTEPTFVNRRNSSADPVYTGNPNHPLGLHSTLSTRSLQGEQNAQGYAVVSRDKSPGTISWKPPETHNQSGTVGSAVKKRRRSSPGPAIVIKDEPDDDGSYAHANQRASLPDSTDDQPQVGSLKEGNKVLTPCQSTDDEPPRPSQPPRSPPDHSETKGPNGVPSERGVQRVDGAQAQWEEVSCAVCQTTGELLSCYKCSKVFHPTCHVPTLLKSPSGEWFCSFCHDPLTSETEYDCKPEARTVKRETDAGGGLTPVDKRKCERLLLQLLCGEPSLISEEPAPPSVCASDILTFKGPINLSTVKKRLESQQSLCYQSPAEFVSDIRLIFGNWAVPTEADTEAPITLWKVGELFEKHLRLTFPDQTFPEIKLEAPPAAPPDSKLSPLDSICQLVKRQRTCSLPQEKKESHEGTNLPSK
ncbi:transcription intermediary factor 1-alpha-like isoform 2-T2 [Odontesthes bonariensis]|uniref:transcription intermediary factor 1-alpha-like isoform X2 n=1 Tax=Odontesthes bonariensis TaxID=219752 RepID=UPI003F583702